MRKLLTALLVITFICIIVVPSDAQVMWRSAKTMKQGSFIAMTHFYYQNISEVWDANDEEWCECDYTKSEWGMKTMFGYAVTDRMEVMAHIPFRFCSFEPDGGEAVDEAGVGDIWLKARFGMFPWAKDKHGFCVTSTLSLPTGDKRTAIALGSGRVKYALGGIFSSKWMGKYRAHVKLNYWFDQKGWTYLTGSGNPACKDVGDNTKLILKNDWKFSKKLMGFATYIMTHKWKDRTAPGTIVANSHKTRHIAQIGAVYKPKKGVFVRPKVAYIFAGEIDDKYEFKPMIDFWYVFTI